MLGIYLNESLSARQDYAPLVLISLVRNRLNSQQISNFLIKVTELLKVINSNLLSMVMWSIYFLFKNNSIQDELTQEFLEVLFEQLNSSNEIVVRIVLYAAAHLYLIGQMEGKIIRALQRLFPFVKVCEMIEYESSAISLGALFAISNFISSDYTLVNRAMLECVIPSAMVVLNSGTWECKNEAACLIAIIIGLTDSNDLPVVFDQEMVFALIDAFELENLETITLILTVFETNLASVPWLLDFLICEDFDQLLLELSHKLEMPDVGKGLYEKLNHRRNGMHNDLPPDWTPFAAEI
jgi:hypothetical protein